MMVLHLNIMVATLQHGMLFTNMKKQTLSIIFALLLVTTIIAGGVLYTDSTITIDDKILATLKEASAENGADLSVNSTEIICGDKYCISYIYLDKVVSEKFITNRYECSNCNFQKNCIISCIEKKQEVLLEERDAFIKQRLTDYSDRLNKQVEEVKAEKGTITIKSDKGIFEGI